MPTQREDVSFRPKSTVVRENKRNTRLASGNDDRKERRAAQRAMKRVRYDDSDDEDSSNSDGGSIIINSARNAVPAKHDAGLTAAGAGKAAAQIPSPAEGALEVVAQGTFAHTTLATPTSTSTSTTTVAETAIQIPTTAADLVDIVKRLKSNRQATPAAWKSLRRYLAHGHASVATFLQTPKAMDVLLHRLNDHNHQLQAAWCITNIAASVPEHTSIAMAAAPTLIALLQSPNPLLQDQVACGLGNMAGDGPACRDLLIKQGISVPLLKLLQSTTRQAWRSAAFALSNMLRGAGATPQAFLQHGILPLVLDGIKRFSKDLHVVTEGYWLLAYLTAGSNPRVVAELIALGVAPLLSAHMQAACKTDSVAGANTADGGGPEIAGAAYITPMLRVAGNCIAANTISSVDAVVGAAAGGVGLAAAASLSSSSSSASSPAAAAAAAGAGLSTEGPAAVLLADGAVPQCLLHCLASLLPHVVLEAAWVVSNVAGGNPAHAAGLAKLGVTAPLVRLLATANAEVQHEVLHALLNVGSWGPQHLAAVVGTAALVPNVLAALQLPDRDLKQRALQMVELLCRAHPAGASEVKRHGGVAVLSGQHLSSNPGLSTAVAELLQRYFRET